MSHSQSQHKSKEEELSEPFLPKQSEYQQHTDKYEESKPRPSKQFKTTHGDSSYKYSSKYDHSKYSPQYKSKHRDDKSRQSVSYQSKYKSTHGDNKQRQNISSQQYKSSRRVSKVKKDHSKDGAHKTTTHGVNSSYKNSYKRENQHSGKYENQSRSRRRSSSKKTHTEGKLKIHQDQSEKTYQSREKHKYGQKKRKTQSKHGNKHKQEVEMEHVNNKNITKVNFSHKDKKEKGKKLRISKENHQIEYYKSQRHQEKKPKAKVKKQLSINVDQINAQHGYPSKPQKKSNKQRGKQYKNKHHQNDNIQNKYFEYYSQNYLDQKARHACFWSIITKVVIVGLIIWV